MDNLRGPRGDGEELSSGKYNPFRILEIGETMIRYCDGLRIKNYNFLAILTSDRLVLIESTKQSDGTIAKEIPVSMIQGAEMERDEKNRPALAVTMEVGGQSRLMKLVFTGLIAEPEIECREWFTAINGYPPEPEVELVSEPIPDTEPAKSEPSPVIDAEVPPPVAEPAIPQEPVVVIPPPPTSAPMVPVIPISTAVPPTIAPTLKVTPAPVVSPASVSEAFSKSIPEKKDEIVENEKQRISIPPPGDASIQIYIEKPDIKPIQIARNIITPVGSLSSKSRYCMHCGSKIPVLARFCPVCGKTQV